MSTSSNTAARAASRSTSDFCITNHGTLFLLRPETRRARAWIAERIVGALVRDGLGVRA